MTGLENRLRRAVPLYSYFIFSLDDRACQQLAKLLLLGGGREVIRWGVGSGAHSLLVRITPFRMSKGIMALLSPLFCRGSMMPMNRSNGS